MAEPEVAAIVPRTGNHYVTGSDGKLSLNKKPTNAYGFVPSLTRPNMFKPEYDFDLSFAELAGNGLDFATYPIPVNRLTNDDAQTFPHGCIPPGSDDPTYEESTPRQAAVIFYDYLVRRRENHQNNGDPMGCLTLSGTLRKNCVCCGLIANKVRQDFHDPQSTLQASLTTWLPRFTELARFAFEVYKIGRDLPAINGQLTVEQFMFIMSRLRLVVGTKTKTTDFQLQTSNGAVFQFCPSLFVEILGFRRSRSTIDKFMKAFCVTLQGGGYNERFNQQQSLIISLPHFAAQGVQLSQTSMQTPNCSPEQLFTQTVTKFWWQPENEFIGGP